MIFYDTVESTLQFFPFPINLSTATSSVKENCRRCCRTVLHPGISFIERYPEVQDRPFSSPALSRKWDLPLPKDRTFALDAKHCNIELDITEQYQLIISNEFFSNAIADPLYSFSYSDG
jgi:hypothetical protein